MSWHVCSPFCCPQSSPAEPKSGCDTSPSHPQDIPGRATPDSHCGWDDSACEMRAAVLEALRLNSGSKSAWGPQARITPAQVRLCPWSSLGVGPLFSQARGSVQLSPPVLHPLVLASPDPPGPPAHFEFTRTPGLAQILCQLQKVTGHQALGGLSCKPLQLLTFSPP